MVWAGKAGDEDGAVLGARNLDSGEERWRDVHQWARSRELLSGKMRVWPSLLAAVFLGPAFVAFVSYASGRASGSGHQSLLSDLLLAMGVAFVPTVVIEWIAVVVIRVNDDEHRRITDLLQGYLRTGSFPP
ncbi:MAG: hypothetical protein ABI702_15855 [Burkholderiales bacterium]